MIKMAILMIKTTVTLALFSSAGAGGATAPDG